MQIMGKTNLIKIILNKSIFKKYIKISQGKKIKVLDIKNIIGMNYYEFLKIKLFKLKLKLK